MGELLVDSQLAKHLFVLRLDTREHDRDAWPSRREIVSASTVAPVASMTVTLAMRRTTTRTSLTLARLQKEVVGGAKNSGPSIR